MNETTLVLHISCMPLAVVSWQRAMSLVFAGKATVMHAYDREVKHPTAHLQVPAVIRLTRTSPPYRGTFPLSRQNVYARDAGVCQYCGTRPTKSDFTLDHVQPKSRGGGYVWTNLVLSCSSCNLKKRDRTPDEASMPLLNKPAPMSWRNYPLKHESWGYYLR